MNPDFDEVDDDLDDFDLEEDEEEEAPRPKKKTKAKKAAPPSDDFDNDDGVDLAETFTQAVGAPREASSSPVMRDLTDDALVLELTELLVQGDDSEMTTVLVPTFTGPRGGKIAKKLIREARDRAIAKLKRVADVACVNIDTFLDED